ncbi:unnamed protein product [Caenorhabditis nigoni]
MRTFIVLLLSLFSAAMSQRGLDLPEGKEDVTLPINAIEPKAFTRKLSNGETQTWNLEGPNKGTWVNAKGNKVPSSNFEFVPPASLKIKKLKKEDSGFYDYIPKNPPPPIDYSDLPPGVDHIDPPEPSGVQVNIG